MALVLWRLVLALMLSFCAVAVIAPRQAPAAELTVFLDEAKLLRLPDQVATVVIGNPLIADASLQPGGFMVVTGKGYGATNLMVLDRAGQLLMERTIEVVGPRGDIVVVYRGIERETYSCTPKCERRVTLGDSNVYFDAAINEGLSRSGSAQGAAPSQPSASIPAPPTPVQIQVPAR
jgi:Flp pilus assembly secretin CpaC